MGRPRRFDSRKVSARGLNPVARWPLQSLPHHLEFVFSRIGLPARSDPLPPRGSAARSHGGGNGIACCKSRGSHPERSTRSARERKLRSRCRNHGAGRGALGRADRPNVKESEVIGFCCELRWQGWVGSKPSLPGAACSALGGSGGAPRVVLLGRGSSFPLPPRKARDTQERQLGSVLTKD